SVGPPAARASRSPSAGGMMRSPAPKTISSGQRIRWATPSSESWRARSSASASFAAPERTRNVAREQAGISGSASEKSNGPQLAMHALSRGSKAAALEGDLQALHRGRAARRRGGVAGEHPLVCLPVLVGPVGEQVLGVVVVDRRAQGRLGGGHLAAAGARLRGELLVARRLGAPL